MSPPNSYSSNVERRRVYVRVERAGLPLGCGPVVSHGAPSRACSTFCPSLLGGASTDIRSTDFVQRSRLNGLQRTHTHHEEECRRWASTAIEDALACARVPGGTGWDNGQRGE